MSTLEIRDLHASVAGKEILRGIDLTVSSGEVHAVMGPNGAGKSTLSGVVMGRPGYEITAGTVTLDGDDIIFNTHQDSGKAKAMAREGRACLLVDMEAPPYAFVKIDGTITFEDDLERVQAVATEIGGRYMGADRAEEFGARNGVPGELVVRLTPTKITAVDDVSGYG